MPIYEAVSPSYECGDWSAYMLGEGGPPEYECKYAIIEAPTKRAAGIAFVRLARKLGEPWWEDSCPFSGIRIQQLFKHRCKTAVLLAKDAQQWTNVLVD